MDVSQPDSDPVAVARTACRPWFGTVPLDVGTMPDAGFSGATLVRVRPRGTGSWFVLKAFVAGTPRSRADRVHGLVRHLAAAGVDEIPVPLATRAGGTLAVDERATIWELVPFVDGVSTERPSDGEAAAALRVLARLHTAAAMLPGVPPLTGVSDGVTRRIARARELLERPWCRRRPPPRPGAEPFAARLEQAVAIFAAADGDRAVAAAAAARVPEVRLQTVLRDVWSAHVLFRSDVAPGVAGIVDPHAAGVDTPAADLARLLGSWRGSESSANLSDVWPEALAAYDAVRPLAAAERGLVPFLHAAGVVCGLDNWFRWTLDEGRAFADEAAATHRIDRLLGDLPAALAWLADRPKIRV